MPVKSFRNTELTQLRRTQRLVHKVHEVVGYSSSMNVE